MIAMKNMGDESSLLVYKGSNQVYTDQLIRGEDLQFNTFLCKAQNLQSSKCVDAHCPMQRHILKWKESIRKRGKKKIHTYIYINK